MRLLDLFCGAGGASMGYYRAGFTKIVGVDIKSQPNYPFTFIQADALCPPVDLSRFDLIHASPPCQFYSAMSECRPGLSADYLDLVSKVRALIGDYPYVIENVPRAPLVNPAILCGQMFGLPLYRHRLFESSFDLRAPVHPAHELPASRAGHWVPGTVMSIAGHVAPIANARIAMGINWMSRDELGEAIPPAYTQWIGERIVEVR